MKQLKRLNNNWLLLLLLGAMALSCNNNNTPGAASNPDHSAAVSIPASISYDILNQYPHDPGAFTEGLEMHNGVLYESTGQYGHSDIRKTNLTTGEVLRTTKLDDKYFGEGLTLLNGKLYQITYREGKGFIYDTGTLKLTGTFHFDAAEGWGMTNNGSSLIFDDGSNTFHYVDPVTFKETKTLRVTDEHGPVDEINEPELINGFIYANQWQTETILKIDTSTGRVVARADLSGIRQRIGLPPMNGRPGSPEVMNGIAWDAKNNRIFITGKNWPKLVEIRLDN